MIEERQVTVYVAVCERCDWSSNNHDYPEEASAALLFHEAEVHPPEPEVPPAETE